MIALIKVLVHGWDLAVATGQFARELAIGPPEVRNGMYGREVPVPDDADAFDRLLGQTGRDPAWRP